MPQALIPHPLGPEVKRCVADAEFDRAVTVTITSAMAMWLPGAPEKVEVI